MFNTLKNAAVAIKFMIKLLDMIQSLKKKKKPQVFVCVNYENIKNTISQVHETPTLKIQ